MFITFTICARLLIKRLESYKGSNLIVEHCLAVITELLQHGKCQT